MKRCGAARELRAEAPWRLCRGAHTLGARDRPSVLWLWQVACAGVFELECDGACMRL